MAGTSSHTFFAQKGKQTYGISLDNRTSIAATVNGTATGVTFTEAQGYVTFTAPVFNGTETVVISGTQSSLIPAH